MATSTANTDKAIIQRLSKTRPTLFNGSCLTIVLPL
jgi:hypothetical protein